VLEAQRLDRVLQLGLHLQIRQHRRRARATGRDEYVDPDPGCLGGLREGQVEVIVDLALVLERAGGAAGGAKAREEDGGGWGDGGELDGPVVTLGGYQGVELAVGAWRLTTDEGVDTGDGGECEES
jgi:hypothetical protein